jgi:hypothetical protein
MIRNDVRNFTIAKKEPIYPSVGDIEVTMGYDFKVGDSFRIKLIFEYEHKYRSVCSRQLFCYRIHKWDRSIELFGFPRPGGESDPNTFWFFT